MRSVRSRRASHRATLLRRMSSCRCLQLPLLVDQLSLREACAKVNPRDRQNGARLSNRDWSTTRRCDTVLRSVPLAVIAYERTPPVLSGSTIVLLQPSHLLIAWPRRDITMDTSLSENVVRVRERREGPTIATRLTCAAASRRCCGWTRVVGDRGARRTGAWGMLRLRSVSVIAFKRDGGTRRPTV